jgi:hypothetical protein
MGLLILLVPYQYPLKLNNICLETSRHVAITKLSMHMEKLLKRCYPCLWLNQFMLKLSFLVMDVVITLLLKNHVAHDHVNSHNIMHDLNIPCSSSVTNNSLPRSEHHQTPAPRFCKSLAFGQTSSFSLLKDCGLSSLVWSRLNICHQQDNITYRMHFH